MTAYDAWRTDPGEPEDWVEAVEYDDDAYERRIERELEG